MRKMTKKELKALLLKNKTLDFLFDENEESTPKEGV